MTGFRSPVKNVSKAFASFLLGRDAIARKHFEVYSDRVQQIATPPRALHQAESFKLGSATDDDWHRLFTRLRYFTAESRPVKSATTLLKHRPIAHFVGRDQTLVDILEKLFLDRRTWGTPC